MVGIELQLGHRAALDQLDDPARIEIDAETDSAAMLAEMFDRQPETAWSRRPEHQPVRPLRKIRIRQSLRQHLVIDPKIVDHHPALRDAGRTARLEDIRGLVRVRFRHPAAHRTASKPLILEMSETREISEPVHIFPGIPSRFLRPLEPEGRARFRREVPLDDFPDVSVEFFGGALDGGGGGGGGLAHACGGSRGNDWVNFGWRSTKSI